jgi:hypothetical protein
VSCIVDPTNGVPGMTTDGNYLTSSTSQWNATSTANGGQFQGFYAYWLMTALKLD